MDDLKSYSLRIILEMLDELGFKDYKTKQFGYGFVHTGVDLMIQGRNLSIQTDPQVASYAFCETYGFVPKDWESDEDSCGDPIRFDTPEALKAFLRHCMKM